MGERVELLNKISILPTHCYFLCNAWVQGGRRVGPLWLPVLLAQCVRNNWIERHHQQESHRPVERAQISGLHQYAAQRRAKCCPQRDARKADHDEHQRHEYGIE